MNQEIDKGQMMPPSSPKMTANPDTKAMCGLSVVLMVVGIAAIIGGLICAVTLTKDYSGYYPKTNHALAVLYLAGGILTGVFNFALAVIVDACDKYREAHKG